MTPVTGISSIVAMPLNNDDNSSTTHFENIYLLRANKMSEANILSVKVSNDMAK